jgi:sugar/nucleoside kinase (ribokinase family)
MTAFVTLGAHVLDVHARPVTEIPEGQGGALLEEIRLSPAGPAGGTAITLAKLGGQVTSVGVLGADDLGDVFVTMLGRFGVDTSHLARHDDVQTSATVLPIRPNGDRPALHVIGANGTITGDDIPWDVVEAADHIHVGAPEFFPELAAEVLERARARGATTSIDILADGWPEMLDFIGAALPHTDWFLPNQEQALNVTAESDVEAAGRKLLERGIGGAAITCGGDGCVVITADGIERVPAFAIEVVDTTGCGDALSAGFIHGLSLGRSPADAARLGSACAALVAQGLGSDAGDFDLAAADRFAADTPMR